jgi:WD repeat-containing protein 19
MVASACEKKGLKQDAIEFLLLAHKKPEAFALAQASENMETYVKNSEEISEEERLKVAQYYEGRGIYDQAALHYE